MSFKVNYQVVVSCPPEHAWFILTTRIQDWWPRGHRRLKAGVLRLEPEVNGRVVETDGEGGEYLLGRVCEVTPPHLLQLDWYLGAPPGFFTTVTLRLTGVGASTRVSVEHEEGPRPLPDQEHKVQLFIKGWTHVLDAFLAFSLENIK